LIDLYMQPRALVVDYAAAMLVRLGELFTHLDRQLAVRDAVGRPMFASIRARQPQLGRKYLNRLHLATGLTSGERAAVMIHHYDVLATRLSPATLAAILDGGVCLWSRPSDAGHHRVDLIFSHPTDNEGELTLDYTLDGVVVSVCSFSFAPGSLVGVADGTIIAVTRVQGIRAARDRLRAAMSAVCGVSPAMIFVAVLTGIAERLGISTIAGIAASAQTARGTASETTLAAVYDNFFESIGGVRATPVFYRIALPRPEMPFAEVKRSNRARTRAQREIRTGIARAACLAFDR
jgi:uncharacterized protein VirK/YbjX